MSSDPPAGTPDASGRSSGPADSGHPPDGPRDPADSGHPPDGPRDRGGGGRLTATSDRGPTSKSARTRQRILDSAARIFRQQGHGARLSDIAAEAGMQAGSLYYHFDGREHLMAEVLRLGIESAWAIVDDALAQAPPEATPLDHLELAIRAHASAVLEMSDYAAANSRIFPMATESVRGEHYGHQQRYGERFHALFTAAAAAGQLRDGLDLPVIRMLLFGAMNWSAEWFRPGRGRSADHVIEQLVVMALGGLVTENHRHRYAPNRATTE